MSRELVDPVQPATHRLAAHLLFAEHGLDAYTGLVAAFEPDLDERGIEIDPDGVDGVFELSNATFWNGKIEHPDLDLDDGMYEYQLGISADDDVGERKLELQFRPGFPDARHVETGDAIGGIPDDCPRSLRVQVEATNLDHEAVLPLLQELAAAIDLNPEYLADPHDWSSVYALETYCRVERETTVQEIVGTGGVIHGIADVSSASGSGKYTWDHEEIKGFYEAVEIDPESWATLLPEAEQSAAIAKRLKCYQPAHVRRDDVDEDPLADHKLEAQYWSDYDSESIAWDDVDAALDELRATVVNALWWAGLDPRLDGAQEHPFVADEYFVPRAAERAYTVVEDPIPALRQQVVGDARDQLIDPETTDTEFAVLDAVTDGGSEQHYQDLAEELGVDPTTIYRATDDLDEILDVDDGRVAFVSDSVRDLVGDVLDRFERTADAVEREVRRIAAGVNPLRRFADSEDPTPLEEWIRRQGFRVEQFKRELRLSLDRPVSQRELLEILREGYRAARADPTLTTEWEQAKLEWTDRDGNDHSEFQLVTKHGLENRLLGLEPVGVFDQ